MAEIYQGIAGNTYILEENRIARGGEGNIYQIQGQEKLVAKIFRPEKRDWERAEKLKWMVQTKLNNEQLEQLTWPQDVLFSENRFVGYVMPKLRSTDSLSAIYSSGTSGRYDLRHRILAANNLCHALQSVHDMGQICGDLNPQNICINLDENDKEHAFHVTLVDTDSYHFTAGGKTYRCEVGLADYLAPELQRELADGLSLRTAPLPTYTKETDLFALAVHIFTLLMNGCHPFACAKDVNYSGNNTEISQGGAYVGNMKQMDHTFWKDSSVAPQPIENIRNGYFPFYESKLGFTIPVYAPSFDSLPENLRNLFIRTFVVGYQNPAARVDTQEWIEALGRLLPHVACCPIRSRHYYFDNRIDCPLCNVDQRIRNMQQKLQTTPELPELLPADNKISVESTAGTYQSVLPVSSASSFPPTLPESGNRSNRQWLRYACVLLFLIIVVGIGIFWKMQEVDDKYEREFDIATSTTVGGAEENSDETEVPENTEIPSKTEITEVQKDDPWELSEKVINCTKFGGSIQIPQGAELEDQGDHINIYLPKELGENLEISIYSFCVEIQQDEDFNEYIAQTSYAEKPDEREIDRVLNLSMDALTVIERCEFKHLNGMWYTMSVVDNDEIKTLQYWISNTCIGYVFSLEVSKKTQLSKLELLLEKIVESMNFKQTEIYGKITVEDGSNLEELPGFSNCEILLLKKDANEKDSEPMVPSDHNYDYACAYTTCGAYTQLNSKYPDSEYLYVMAMSPGKYQALITIWDDDANIIGSYTLEISVPTTDNDIAELDINLSDDMKLTGEGITG